MGGSEFSQKWQQESDQRAWCRWMPAEQPDDGLLLNHKKERNWVTFRDVDGPRICHTEWSKLEREKQISYISVYMWNLEKCYRWAYFQGRIKDTESRHVGTVGEGEDGSNWEIKIDIYVMILKSSSLCKLFLFLI